MTFEGLTFFEVASVTKISGGIAMNVIPETCTAHVNFRYAPGRTPAEAEERLAELTCGLGTLTVTGNAPSGAVAVDHPQAQKLIQAGSLHVAPKQAWTPVAEFALAGYPGVNFGPGATSQAHQRDEWVEIAALLRSLPGARGLRHVRRRTSCSVRLSPVLDGLATYPFVRLEQARARLRAAGVEIIDFGMGEPREETPAFIRSALAEAIKPLAPYPTAVGLPELRAAIAGWASRRFGVTLDPDTQVIPTLGSKEAVFGLANVFAGEVVAVPTPSYPVYERGAVFAGKRVLELPLREDRGWLPDLGGGRLVRRRRAVAELPEQPDGRAGAGLLLRAGGCSGPRARVRAGLRRGLLRAVLRGRAAGERIAGERPLARRGLQHALQALLDARLPVRASSPATRRSWPR